MSSSLAQRPSLSFVALRFVLVIYGYPRGGAAPGTIRVYSGGATPSTLRSSPGTVSPGRACSSQAPLHLARSPLHRSPPRSVARSPLARLSLATRSLTAHSLVARSSMDHHRIAHLEYALSKRTPYIRVPLYIEVLSPVGVGWWCII